MKKLLFFTPYYFPHNGACTVRNDNFLKAIKGKFEVDLLVATRGGTVPSLVIKPRTNKSHFIFRLLFEILAGYELFLRVLFSKYDLYYFSSPNFFTVFIGAAACAIKKKSYVLDIRDIYPESLFKVGLIREESWIGRKSKYWTKYIYDNASEIITVTPPLVDIIKSYTDTPVHLIPNGYEEELFKPSAEKYEDFTCVFHGTLGTFQNIRLILKIAAISEKYEHGMKFIVVGDGSKGDMIREATWLSNLEFYGQTDYKELPGIISKAHVGLSFRADDETSLFSFPVKVFEYIGTELPIISTTNNEASQAIVKYDIGAYFENPQVQEIYDEIKKLKDEPAYYQQKVENIKKIKHIYSRTEQAKKFAEILESVK